MDLNEPQVWDDLYYHHTGHLEQVALLTDPAHAVRSAHACFHLTQDAAKMLRRLKGLTAAPVGGLRLLALCHLGQYDRVLRRGFNPRGASPLELEEAVYGEWALSIAHAELGRRREATERLERAVYLARLLGLSGRVEVLTLECERQRTLSGQPDAERVAKVTRRLRNPRAARFGHEVYVETLLAQGRYADAHRAAGRYKVTPGLAELTAALARALPPAATESPLGELARAHRVARLGQPTPLPTLPDEPWRTYATLIRVVGLMVRGDNVSAYAHLPQGGTPDQCATAAGFAWALWLKTGRAEGRPLALPATLGERLGELYDAVAVATRLVAAFPSEMMVLELIGAAHPALSGVLASAPLLGLGAVRRNLETFSFAHVTTEAFLLDALNGDALLQSGMHRQERKRWRDGLLKHGLHETELVNPAAVYRYLERLEAHTRTAGRVGEKNAVSLALLRAGELLPASIFTVATTLPRRVA